MTPTKAPEMAAETPPSRPVRETDEEREQREAREEAERLAARAREVAALDDDRLCKETTDDDLHVEDARLRDLPRPSTRAITTVPRKMGHARIDSARQALAGAAAGAIITAARGAAKADGPSLEDLRRAHALHLLAEAPESLWAALHAAVDAPAPRGMSEAFTDNDPVAEAHAERRRIEARRDRISAELEARAVARRAAAHPGMAQRIAALVKGDGK